ncbi:MAG: UDP-N-acetylmuramate dehydrogenase [Bacteroidota bacterium]
MKMQEAVSLKPYNTFGIDVSANRFVEVTSAEELITLLKNEEHSTQPLLILGGGSNLLLTKDFNGLVIKNSINGIAVTTEDDDYVFVKAGAGEVWHHFVLFCIENNLAGVENLSLIPGNVGAGPMQNIGAYGVELKDVFQQLEALHIKDRTMKIFSKEECRFGYRESVFKNVVKGQYIITSVTFRLNKIPVLNTSYGAIEQELQRMGVKEPTIKSVSDAVIHIRRSKLPDPAVLGNAGSFFKNPEIEMEHYEKVKLQHPGLVAYPAAEGRMKVAAGWLIEQCGWKGKRVGNTGSHKDQALVLVNYGGAKGNEIFDLALDIKRSVQERFGIDIEPEVNVI